MKMRTPLKNHQNLPFSNSSYRQCPVADFDIAEIFGTAAHAAVGQKRDNGDPYITHPRRVAALVAQYFPHDIAMHCAAILHDVIEDTKVKYKLIKLIFGEDVANLVRDLSKVSKKTDGDRAVRKAIDLAHLKQISIRAKIIKLCDILDNLSDDPLADPEFMKVYVPEKRQVVNEALSEVAAVCPLLYMRVNEVITSLEQQLGV